MPSLRSVRESVWPAGTATLFRTIVGHDFWAALACAAPLDPEKVHDARCWIVSADPAAVGAETARDANANRARIVKFIMKVYEVVTPGTWKNSGEVMSGYLK